MNEQLMQVAEGLVATAEAEPYAGDPTIREFMEFLEQGWEGIPGIPEKDLCEGLVAIMEEELAF